MLRRTGSEVLSLDQTINPHRQNDCAATTWIAKLNTSNPVHVQTHFLFVDQCVYKRGSRAITNSQQTVNARIECLGPEA